MSFIKSRLFVRVTVVVVGLCVLCLIWLQSTLPSIDTLEDPDFSLPTIIYDRHGNQVDELYVKRRKLVKYEELPNHLVNALLAKEDVRFTEHHGMDPIRIIKAAWVNLLALDTLQGASTLTQQTARQFFLTLEKTWSRKVREILLALKIERKFTKEQIITLYLNKVNFGDAWGVSAAAEYYFSKEVQELNLEEVATLVGLLPAPNLYKPTRNPHLALMQRNIVLQRMEAEKVISSLEYLVAVKRPLKIAAQKYNESRAVDYYVELVRRKLQDKFGSKKLYEGGLHVYTAMSLDFQKSAYQALVKGVNDITKRQGYRPTEEVVEMSSSGSPSSEIFASLNPSVVDISTEDEKVFQAGKIYNAVVLNVNSKRAILQLSLKYQGVLLLDDVRQDWKISLRYQEENHQIQQEVFSSLSQVIKVGNLIKVSPLDETQSNLIRFQLHQDPLANGAIYAADPNTGEVLAMVGGVRFGRSQGESEFIRATQAKRQPGSAFKPIIYATALDEGFTPATILDDSPRTFVLQTGKKHTPHNYDQRFLGYISLRESLVRSRNVPTVQLVQNIGVERVIEYSRKFGISTAIPKEGLIALGTHSVKLSELTRAYGVFASGGYLAKPIYILRVEDNDGNILLENLPESEEVISPSTAFLITDILHDVVRRPAGTAYNALKEIKRPTAGKTGTTQNYTNAWYIGFLPQLTAGVYIGIDDHRKPIGAYETGSRAAAPVWKNFISAISPLLNVESFLQPNSVVVHRVNENGQIISGCDKQTHQRYELFKQESIPPRFKNEPCESLPNIARTPLVEYDDLAQAGALNEEQEVGSGIFLNQDTNQDTSEDQIIEQEDSPDSNQETADPIENNNQPEDPTLDKEDFQL